jgi:hypothetical protein
MDEQTLKAFDFAKEVTVQLITLSTGIIALEVTLLKEVIKTISYAGRWFLLGSWIALLISVICGILTMLALTGNLQPKDGTMPPTIWAGSVTRFSICQIASFLVGLALTILFGAKTIWSIAT